jgi:UrcA family protein
MNTKLENTFHATVLAGALVISLLFVAGTTFAASPDVDVRSETVKFQDLNLQADADVAALYQRIHAAARRVCDEPGEAGLSSANTRQSCKEKAESEAIMKVNVPALSAYYEQKSGRPVPMLAKAQ